MAQNFNIGTLGQVLAVNTAANATTYSSVITIGNTTTNSIINSTSISTTTLVVSNVTQTQTNLQVDPAGTAVALAIALG
jgi:uncharacterized membrane protein